MKKLFIEIPIYVAKSAEIDAYEDEIYKEWKGDASLIILDTGHQITTSLTYAELVQAINQKLLEVE